MRSSLAPGVWFLRAFSRDSWFRGFILLITFFIYTCYHMSRKPISVVKSRLHHNCSGIIQPTNNTHSINDTTWCNWAPFDQSNYKELLGAVDNAFLVAYAIGMFISGIFGERLPLRYYLSAGMLLSGLFTALFGLGYFWNIHVLWYFVLVQICNGLAQTTGWPSVVACVGNWFGKGKRGLIMGIWNSHTSVGNILGSLIAGIWVDEQWGLSFIVPGIITAIMGLITFFFLIEYPEDVDCTPPQHHVSVAYIPALLLHPGVGPRDAWALGGGGRVHTVTSQARGRAFGWLPNRSLVQSRRGHVPLPVWEPPPLLWVVPAAGGRWYVMWPQQGLLSAQVESEDSQDLPEDSHSNRDSSLESAVTYSKEPGAQPAAISFFGALRIPGVIEFSLCLLFAKLVSYTFLYWLPLYIFNVVHFTAKEAGDLSTLFDVGGIIGGILAGLISDYTNGRATTCCVMLILAAPMMFLYNSIGQRGISISIVMLIISGALVNGPYALITTAVSADLGTHKSLKGNAKALSTVTAIIDGTGSIGAALGPLLAGLISPTGWNNVFYMLISADILACLLLCRLVYKEVLAWKSSLHRDRGSSVALTHAR
uniref:Solute carrier family 37 member 2 n=1 Tax=Sus scrofa TaxID=9823 RepID=A0A8D0RP12_PIG